jgi:predicted nucleic acid-binding protein
MAEGLLDTNIFIHAHTTDALSGQCRGFLAALEEGRVQARLEPLILHELSYALRHHLRQMTRDDLAQYLVTVLSWPGVVGDKDLLVGTVQRWQQAPGLSFADAYLAELAVRRGVPVHTKNVRELAGQRVEVPDPLPQGA